MLRRTLLASAGAMALTGAALAADLPSRAPPPVFLPPPPVFTWTGLYVGVNAGYEWSASNSVDVDTATVFNNTAALSAVGLTYGPAAAAGATGNFPVQTNGFIGGGQIGYNLQFANNFVAGIEADIQGIAGSNGSASAFTVTPRTPFFPPDAVDTSLSVSKRIDYLGTVRGRLGFLLTPTLLIFGDGGLAYGGVQSATSIAGGEVPNTGSTNFSGVGTISTSRVGWTAGGGLEWLFAPNWSVKAEYLYYDLGTVTYGTGPMTTFLTGTPTVTFVNQSRTTTRFNGNIVRAGLNYHFNLWGPAPVVAKY
ncbi:MAG: outer membrane protein [Methylocella sp.]